MQVGGLPAVDTGGPEVAAVEVSQPADGLGQSVGGAQDADARRHRGLEIDTSFEGDEPRDTLVIGGGRPRAQLAGQDLGDPAREHETFEQRVGGQAVGTVHAAARHLARGEETGYVAAAIEVRDHTAGGVVLGRRDGDQVGRGVDAVLAADCEDRRESLLPELRTEVAGVEPHVRPAGLEHPAGDRLGHHVAGREIGELVLAQHEAGAALLGQAVDEECPLAADRLGDEGLLALGLGTEIHDRRVELDELQIAQRRPRAQRDRHPVAGRDAGIGRLGEHLPQPPTGKHDSAAVSGTDTVALALSEHVQGHPGDTGPTILVRVGQEQVDCQGVLDDLDLGRLLDGSDEGALDLGPSGVTARVGDAVAQVPALAGQRELSVVVVELGA